MTHTMKIIYTQKHTKPTNKNAYKCRQTTQYTFKKFTQRNPQKGQKHIKSHIYKDKYTKPQLRNYSHDDTAHTQCHTQTFTDIHT